MKNNNETKEKNNFMNITPPIQEDSYNLHMIDVVNNDPQVFNSLDPVQQVDLANDLQKTYGNQYVQNLINSQNNYNEKTKKPFLQTKKENINNDSEVKNRFPSRKNIKSLFNNLHHQIQLENTLFQVNVHSHPEIGAVDDPLDHETEADVESVMHLSEPLSSFPLVTEPMGEKTP